MPTKLNGPCQRTSFESKMAPTGAPNSQELIKSFLSCEPAAIIAGARRDPETLKNLVSFADQLKTAAQSEQAAIAAENAATKHQAAKRKREHQDAGGLCICCEGTEETCGAMHKCECHACGANVVVPPPL